MTVSTTSTSHTYHPADAMAAESLAGIAYLAASDLRVWHEEPATGERTLLSLGSDYVLGGDGTAASGTITATAEWPADDLFIIERWTNAIQPTAIPAHEPLPAADMERSLDRNALVAQEARARAELAVSVPVGRDPLTIDPVGLIDGDLLEYRDGALRRFDHAPFAGKFYSGDAAGRPVPASGTGADGALRADLAEDTGASLIGTSYGETLDHVLRALSAEAVVPLSAFGGLAAGEGSDDGALGDALAYLEGLTPPGGAIEITARNVVLSDSHAVGDSVTIAAMRANVAAAPDGDAVLSFGWGTNGTVNQIARGEVTGGHWRVSGAGKTWLRAQNTDNMLIRDCDVDLLGNNSIGIHVKAVVGINDDYPDVAYGPYYGAIENVRVSGGSAPLATGRIGILLEGEGVQGSAGVNRWHIRDLRHIAVVEHGLDIRAADGLVIHGGNFEVCTGTAIRFGHGARSYTGTAAGTSTASRIDDAGLAAIDLDQSATLEVLTGPNAGFTSRIAYYDPGFVALHVAAPAAFTAGNSYRITEAKARSITHHNPTFEQGTPSDATVAFTAGSLGCHVSPAMFTQVGGTIMRRQVEDLSNWFGKSRHVVWMPFEIDFSVEGASGSKIISPGYLSPYLTRGGILNPFGGYIDAVIIQAAQESGYAGSVTAVASVDGTALPADLRPVLNGVGFVRAMRVRKSLVNGDLINAHQVIHVRLDWTGIEVDVTGQVGLVLVEF